MLPLELLRVRIRHGLVKPAYVERRRDLDVLNDVLALYEQAAQNRWKLSELEERLGNLSEVYDYRLVKGVSRLLRRRVRVSQESKISPREVRKLLFSLGPVLSSDERAKLLESIAAKYDVAVKDVEESMFADIEEEKRVVELRRITLEQLASWYNAELAETLVAKSTRLVLRAGRLWSTILRKIKRLGLIYEVSQDNPSVEITGPASALKLSDRYARLSAELLPLLVTSIGEWRVEGEVALGSKKRILPFQISSSDASFWYPPDVPRPKPRAFDSSVEEKFYHAMRQAAPDLTIVREPAPISLGDKVMVPDFKVEKNGRSVYVEIVGFWTPEYVRRKIEKLRRFSDAKLLVIADSSLGLSQQLPASDNLVLYEGELPIKEILSRIRSLLGSGERGERRVAHEAPKPKTGLSAMLEELLGKPFHEVEAKLKPILGDSWLSALEANGYTFDWRVLDVRRARLVKKKQQ